MENAKRIAEIEPKSGTYLLILRSKKETTIEVGKIGSMNLRQGYYFYVGSAFGSGGIKARVNRHFSREKALRWHIDYLRAQCTLENVLINYSQTKRESEWVETLLNTPEYNTAFKGFGASDSVYPSHLFYSAKRISNKQIAKTLSTKNIITV